MFGMPVERKAVERSPHGIVIASRGLSGNGISIVFWAAGTRTSLPSTRASPPFGMLSTIVFIVPALVLKPRNASASDVAPGSASDRALARQSEGTTSKPVPGRTAIPDFFAFASRAKTDSKTSTSPVMSRYAVFERRQASRAGALVLENGPAARSRAAKGSSSCDTMAGSSRAKHRLGRECAFAIGSPAPPRRPARTGRRPSPSRRGSTGRPRHFREAHAADIREIAAGVHLVLGAPGRVVGKDVAEAVGSWKHDPVLEDVARPADAEKARVHHQPHPVRFARDAGVGENVAETEGGSRRRRGRKERGREDFLRKVLRQGFEASWIVCAHRAGAVF